MSDTIEFSDCFFHSINGKRYVTLNLAHDLDCDCVGISTVKTPYNNPDFGGFKNFGWYVTDDEDFSKATFQIDNVKIVATKKMFEGKLMRSAIVKLDMTDAAHRTVAMNLKKIYERIFRLIADRRADPHIVLTPSASEIVKNICKKKKISAQEQEKLDEEVRRVFSFSKIVSGLELDSDGQPLPTCEPALFLKIVSSDRFSTTITDVARGNWKPDQLLKKAITGNIRFSLNSISFSGKGVKLNLDATLIYIKKIEKIGAIDTVIAEMEETITEEEKKAFLEQKRLLEEEKDEDEDNDNDGGIPDDDAYPDDDEDPLQYEN